jgi:hypothetical protein
MFSKNRPVHIKTKQTNKNMCNNNTKNPNIKIKLVKNKKIPLITEISKKKNIYIC